MTEHTVDPRPITPPPLPKKRSWRWFKVAVWSVLTLILLFRLASCASSLDLEVTRLGAWTRDDDRAFEVTNVGRSAISIKNIAINDRTDCTVKALKENVLPLTLGVGDKQLMYSNCRIVQLTVQADEGSATYSFNR